VKLAQLAFCKMLCASDALQGTHLDMQTMLRRIFFLNCRSSHSPLRQPAQLICKIFQGSPHQLADVQMQVAHLMAMLEWYPALSLQKKLMGIIAFPLAVSNPERNQQLLQLKALHLRQLDAALVMIPGRNRRLFHMKVLHLPPPGQLDAALVMIPG
jgi:hypothetical protein